MKDKLKILAIPPNGGGCAQVRLIQPMQKLQEKYPDEVEIRFNEDPLGFEAKDKESFTYEDMKWCDVVFTCNIHKYGGDYTVGIAQAAHDFGKFMHFDTDDLLTDLYDGHRHYDTYKQQNLDNVTKAMYHMSDLVSVTQTKFAERIAPYCNNGVLAVIKNSIDFNLPCWNQPPIPSKKGKTRIGWVGGIHHEEDVKEFKGVMLSLAAKVGSENVFWKLNGKPPVQPGEESDWQQEVWRNYANWLTLGAKKSNVFIGNALPIEQYGVFYRDMDISIAPLQDNPFNDSKSEIKLMECGRYGIPLVCTDVGCYSEVIENGKTGYLIGKDNSAREWTRRLEHLCKNPEKRIEMGENLRTIVNNYYDMNKHIGGRLDMYKQVIAAKKAYFETLKDGTKENRDTETVQEASGTGQQLESQRGRLQEGQVSETTEDVESGTSPSLESPNILQKEINELQDRNWERINDKG